MWSACSGRGLPSPPRIPIDDTSAADLVRHMTGVSIEGAADGQDGRAAGVAALRADGIRLKADGLPVDLTCTPGRSLAWPAWKGTARISS